jgi:hypothetical protein
MASRDIACMEFLGNYQGSRLNDDQARRILCHEHYDRSRYLLRDSHDVWIDAFGWTRATGSRINAPNKGEVPNVEFIGNFIDGKPCIEVVALRDIKKGEELLAEYDWSRAEAGQDVETIFSVRSGVTRRTRPAAVQVVRQDERMDTAADMEATPSRTSPRGEPSMQNLRPTGPPCMQYLRPTGPPSENDHTSNSDKEDEENPPGKHKV